VSGFEEEVVMRTHDVPADAADDERRYRDLVEQLPMPLTVHRGGAIVYVNASLAGLVGVDEPAKLIGRELIDFIDPVGHDDHRERLRRLYDGEQLTTHLHIRTVDGRSLDAEVTGIPIVFDGEPAVLSLLQDVTARRREEAALRSSEARFRSLVQRGSDLVAVIDREGCFTYASPSVKDLVGVDPDSLVGQSAFSFVHPADLVAMEDLFVEYLTEPQVETNRYTVRVRSAGGGWRHIELLVENMLDEPDVAGLVLSAWDMTERTEVEHSLRVSEARFRALVQNATDMIVVLDARWRFTYLSPAVTTTLGWSPTELLGRHLTELVHDQDLPALTEKLARRSSDDEGIPLVHRLAHRDGGFRWVEALVTSHYEDPAVRGLVVNARDVTWRVEAEAAMRASEIRHRALIEHISDVVVVTDGRARVSYVSPALERVLGWSAEVAAGKSLFAVVHADDRERTRTWLTSQLARTGLAGPHRLRLQRADGAYCHIEAMANNRLDDPAVQGLVFIARDITAQVAAEDGLRYLALHDPLTGLPNRTLVTDRLCAALAARERQGGSTAVLVLDLDGFKQVNDSFGHDAGDAVLVELAWRMQAALRDVDTVGRLGGDEFAVVLPSAGSKQEALDAAGRLLEVLARPVHHPDFEIALGASIGMALAPHDGEEAGTLLRNADAAMFRAKHGRLGVATCGDAAEPQESSETGGWA
jgi:diguanylate cyclase (GGDEF)-like protein/PAS domain S-box-containing protein